MITEEDVYVAYRRAKSFQSGKGYKLPKDWEEHITTKITPTNREYLTKTADYFNTIWSNINLDEYMECGCELYKSFSYHMFLKPQVHSLYVEKDKQRKRRIKQSTSDIDKSFDHINSYLKKYKLHSPDYTNLQLYCKVKDEKRRVIISDYLQNIITPLLLVYCIYYKYIILTDIEREYCYNISNRYRDFLQDMFGVEGYIRTKEGLQ